MVKPILTEAERTVMKIIWDADHDLVLREVLAEVNETYKRGWCPQTVTAYLSHLTMKGFIEMYKDGRLFLYRTVITEAEYRKLYTKKEVVFWNKGDRLAYAVNVLSLMDVTDKEMQKIEKLRRQ